MEVLRPQLEAAVAIIRRYQIGGNINVLAARIVLKTIAMTLIQARDVGLYGRLADREGNPMILRCAECQGTNFHLVTNEDGTTQIVCYYHGDHVAAIRGEIEMERGKEKESDDGTDRQ